MATDWPGLQSSDASGIPDDADDPTCSAGIYRTGDTFIDRGGGHVDIARNEGAVDMVLYATYLVPAGVPIRTDAPKPGTFTF